MFKIIVGRLVRKYGLKGLLLKVGDLAVKITKSKKDDKAWAAAKKVINKF